MKKLILASAFALPLMIATTAGSPSFAQSPGPARPDQGYLPPGSWAPGSTDSTYSVWGPSYVADNGCTYQNRYEKDIGEIEPHLAETVLVWCPPPPPPIVDNPPAPATGAQTATNDPPPPPPPPQKDPPEPPAKPKPVTGFVDPQPQPPQPPEEPSTWERFKRWCKSFLECQDEATQKKEYDEALHKAVEERRAELRKEHEKRAEHSKTVEKGKPSEPKQESKLENSKTRGLKQDSKLNIGKPLKNLHAQNRLERSGLAHPAKSNLHSINAMSRGHSFGHSMGGMHGLGSGMHGLGGMRGGRLSMR